MKKINIFPVAIFLFILNFEYSCSTNTVGNNYEIAEITNFIITARNNLVENNCEMNEQSNKLNKYDTCRYNKYLIYIGLELNIIKNHGGLYGVKIADSLKELLVISNNDYNENYKKGDTLNNIITIYNEAGSAFNDNGFCELLPNFIKKTQNFGSCILFFTEPPEIKRLHRFTIQYKAYNRKLFSDTTVSVYIKP